VYNAVVRGLKSKFCCRYGKSFVEVPLDSESNVQNGKVYEKKRRQGKEMGLMSDKSVQKLTKQKSYTSENIADILTNDHVEDEKRLQQKNEASHRKSALHLRERLLARSAIRYTQTLQKIEMFKDLNTDAISQIINVMEFRTFEKSEHLVVQGEPGLEFMVIVKGATIVVRDNEEVDRLQCLDWLGEGALVNKNHRRQATVTADVRTDVLVLSSKGYQELCRSGTIPSITSEMLSDLSRSYSVKK